MNRSATASGRREARKGPTLTAVLWDPGRGSTALLAAASSAADRTALPTSVEPGRDDGLVQVHVWVGSLGLGMPGDEPADWAPVGLGLGSVVEQARPVLALSAPEWSVPSLVDPDPDLLGPGLACGWARLEGMDADRESRFATLASRGVVHEQWDGYAWAAEGAVALDGVTAGTTARVTSAVARAWFGVPVEGG